MLDEIDKLGADFRGDPSSALLEVLDPEQNHSFSDHYLDLPTTSRGCCSSRRPTCSIRSRPALRDRMEVITIPGYTEEEKVQIARHFVVPRQLEQHGIETGRLDIIDDALRHLIRVHPRGGGAQPGGRWRTSVKVARRVAKADGAPAAVPDGRRGGESAKARSPGTGWRLPGAARTPGGGATWRGYLDRPPSSSGQSSARTRWGVAYGLSVNEYGGDLIEVEATWMPEGERADRHRLTLTGRWGTGCRSPCARATLTPRGTPGSTGTPPSSSSTTPLHVHVPAGAVPKDGPSAGITMTTAIVSALSGRPVRSDVATTGEVTLRGAGASHRGGKKGLRAHRAGICILVLPAQKEGPRDPGPTCGKGLRIIWWSGWTRCGASAPVALALPVPVEEAPDATTEVIPAQPSAPPAQPAWTN